MENAGCIFYSERSVNGKRNHETLFAHEIAHQWFGDGVSEFDWHHLWISEGFATYLTDIYLEHLYGKEAMITSLKDKRRQVIEYSRRRPAPVVDTTLRVSVELLNPNSYKKAAWALHMLRRELGDVKFRQSIRAFYSKYAFRNALTDDFRWIVDSISGGNYGPFFRQWFYRPGHPVLSASMKYKKKKIILDIKQLQGEDPFFFPLDLEIELENGEVLKHTYTLDQRNQSFTIDSHEKPLSLRLDPGTWLLYKQGP